MVDLSGFWDYLYNLFANWLGMLLVLDGFLALAERFLGEFMERRFNLKKRIPSSYKLGFALIVFMVAQGFAYHNLQGKLSQSIQQDRSLHDEINKQKGEISILRLRIKELESAPPKAITGTQKVQRPPETEPLKISGSIRWLEPSPEKGKYAKALILIPTKDVTHVRLAITCDRDFNQVNASLWSVGAQIGGARRIGPNQAYIDISQPAWEAFTPLVVRFYFDDVKFGTCRTTWP